MSFLIQIGMFRVSFYDILLDGWGLFEIGIWLSVCLCLSVCLSFCIFLCV